MSNRQPWLSETMRKACEIVAADLTKHLEGTPTPACSLCGELAEHVRVGRVFEDGRVEGPFVYFCEQHRES